MADEPDEDEVIFTPDIELEWAVGLDVEIVWEPD